MGIHHAEMSDNHVTLWMVEPPLNDETYRVVYDEWCVLKATPIRLIWKWAEVPTH